jgi:3-oxoacyl-[acyl-carrier protein] reductase
MPQFRPASNPNATAGLSRQVALVTGAGRGIGRATALALAEAGASLVLADIDDPVETAEAIGAHGGRVLSLATDIADEESVLRLFQAVRDRYRKLDILIHCAGVIDAKPLLETSTEDFDRIIAVNLRGTFLVGREAIRMMALQNGGRVVLLASDLGYLGRETFSPYVASKHGVLGLARSWAIEFAPGILVNAICPGPIETAVPAANGVAEAWRERELDIPLHRFGLPDEVAALAVFLAGPSARFITGQGLGVNGGSVMP